MKLFVEKGSKADDVNKIFTTCYPFLKIEFHKKPSGHQPLAKKESALLNPFANLNSQTVIDINNEITVAELEKQFLNVGVLVEVLRRSGNVWIETTLTNSWTLKQQNDEGEEISRHFNEKKIQLPKS